jgi:hypothetical protein
VAQRQFVWIDSRVQGALVIRCTIYWFAAVLFFGSSAAWYHWWSEPDASWYQRSLALFEMAWPNLPSILLILPLVAYDMVKLSNRFTGPVYRSTQHLNALLECSRRPPLRFRDDDYWTELAEPINQLQARMIALEDEVLRLRKQMVDATAPRSPEPRATVQYVDEPLASPAAVATA